MEMMSARRSHRLDKIMSPNNLISVIIPPPDLTRISNLEDFFRSLSQLRLSFEHTTMTDLNTPLSDDFVVPTNRDIGATLRPDSGE